MKVAERKVHLIARALLSWFESSARKMEWRETSDPYRIWVSEIMLQQTTVKTVLPYYRRFIDTFPTVEDLARASLDQVLKSWEGLGYYSRARNLHRSAWILVETRGSTLPCTVDALMALPGIGRSTAGAIASIAFGRDEPILDGNTRRVIARLFAVKEDLSGSPAQKTLWHLSSQLITKSKGRETAMALMDLGNLICMPGNPKCLICPLKAWCLACKQNIQGKIPFKAKKNPLPHYEVVLAIIENKSGEIFIDHRPDQGLLGGLWEFPGGKRQENETFEEAVSREVLGKLGIGIDILRKLTILKHSYTHYRVTIHVYHCYAREETIRSDREWKWIEPGEVRNFAFPKSNQVAAKFIGLPPFGHVS